MKRAFRPDHAGVGALDALGEIRQRLIVAFDAVLGITDDSLLRELFNLIDATLRTNFYLPDAGPVIALKFDSLGLMSAPTPKPYVEIFVHAPTYEGVHLRGARVARGGLRWSDRAHDLRSEILGLMQTQMIKNALIVPQGAKGGFVLKAPSPDPVSREKEGREAYRSFIGALLDLTDNIAPARRLVDCTMIRIPIWSSPRTKARLDGRTSPIRLQSRAASGWATLSQQAAPMATTTRS